MAISRIGNNGIDLGNVGNTDDGILHINASSGAKNIVIEADRDSEGQGLGNLQFHSAGTNVVQVSGARGSSDAKGDLVFYTDGGSLTERMRIDEDGHITKPTQPAFLALPASNVTNFSKDGNNTIAFGTEVFDQNGDFATPNFTAPVTGRYQLNLMVYLYQIQNDAQYYFTQIVTSNRTYMNIIDPEGWAEANYHSFIISILADMDASDTAYGNVYQAGGTNTQTDIISDSNGTYFSGYLVA